MQIQQLYEHIIKSLKDSKRIQHQLSFEQVEQLNQLVMEDSPNLEILLCVLFYSRPPIKNINSILSTISKQLDKQNAIFYLHVFDKHIIQEQLKKGSRLDAGQLELLTPLFQFNDLDLQGDLIDVLTNIQGQSFKYKTEILNMIPKKHQLIFSSQHKNLNQKIKKIQKLWPPIP